MQYEKKNIHHTSDNGIIYITVIENDLHGIYCEIYSMT